jgi:thiamine-phosphate pyrophosphorylase
MLFVVRDFHRSLAVYVVTSSGLVPGRGHSDVARAAIEGGAGTVQLRAPELQDRPEELLRVAGDIAALCHPKDVLFIVNDVIDVAIESGAAGVHLGQGNEVAGAREALGPDRVLGISAGTPEQARAAEHLGATYLGVTVFSTATKPEARPVGLGGLREIVAATSLPVVGIGGIDASNAPVVLSTGATGVAVVTAVGEAEDPVGATQELVAAVTGFFRGVDKERGE